MPDHYIFPDSVLCYQVFSLRIWSLTGLAAWKNKADKELKSVKQNKKGKTAKELMTRHIVNEDDVISDEDFKNLIIEIAVTNFAGSCYHNL